MAGTLVQGESLPGSIVAGSLFRGESVRGEYAGGQLPRGVSSRGVGLEPFDHKIANTTFVLQLHSDTISFMKLPMAMK